jgi:hypothetical protein
MEIGPVQKKIAGAMFLVLVLCLSFMTYIIYRAKTDNFPPSINVCPDFYTLEGTLCKRPPSYPTSAPESFNTSLDIYKDTNPNSLCKKKRWAKQNSVTWDGITNNEMIVPC